MPRQQQPRQQSAARQSSRRQFIKKSSLAVATGATLGVGKGAHAAGGDTLRIGLIGCGGRGTGAAGQALSVKQNVKLVALGDAFGDRLASCLQSLQQKHPDRVDVPADRQFVGFGAYQQVIDADVVVMATPPGFRPTHFEAAINAGKHVFMEKPVAVDAAGVRRVLAAAEESKRKNLKVGVGLQRHHALEYQETISRLQDGAIGDILFTRVYWNGGGVWTRPRKPEQTEMEYQMRNWYYFNWLCGDHIVEQHIHNLDVSNWLKGTHPVSANGMGGRQVRTGVDHGEIFDHHFVEFTYPDGSKMFSQCRHIRGCWNSVSEFATGTKGESNCNGSITLKHPWGSSEWKAPKGSNAYQVEHDVLFQRIVDDEAHNEAENGAHASMTAILGRMATYSGKQLSWEDALSSDVALAPREYGSFLETPPVLPDDRGRYAIATPGATKVV